MDKIGRYEVEHELGRGAMGIVYRAFDPTIGRRIAIKTIRFDELGDEQTGVLLRQRLMKEAQSAGILSHPNIVTIYDVSEDDKNAYIFMEYVEGATLDSFARGLATSELLAILEQAAAALDYAHSRGIVHRDIKPGNLMLSGRQVKVTDFGIARLQHRDSTQTGGLLGTPGYMSPEQIADSEITGAADQYSLGVIAYEFLSGVKPFENDNLANLLYRITQAAVPPVARLNAATNQVLARVLAKAPRHRYPTCAAFVVALEQALGLEGPRYTPEREASGDEPTVMTGARVEEAAAPVPFPMNVPLVNLPPLNLPPPMVASRWKPVAGAMAGAVVLIGLLWFSFGRGPEPVLLSNAANVAAGPTKPSAVGAQVVAPPVETTPGPVGEEKTIETEAPAERTQPGVHSILFASSPEGAEILIDNGKQDRCRRTPCSLELPGGEYQLTGKLAGFDDVSRTLQVPEQSKILIEFEKPSGTIVVNSIPEGATVRINGRDTAQKTPAVLKLAPGKYTLELVKEGLIAQSQEVTVRNGVIQTLSIQWK